MLQIHFAVLLIFLLGMTSASMSSSYKLIYERAEVVNYNPDYFIGATIKNYKYNRTQAVSNGTFTLKRDISLPFKVHIQAYKFLSNEYRNFPILFSYNYCEGLRNDDFGLRGIYKCGNISATPCPFKKGTYHVCKFFPDGEKYPPNIPEGRYMLDIKFFEGATEIGLMQAYGEVKYKNWWGH